MTDFKSLASKVLYEASKRTWENRKGLIGDVLCPNDTFSGLRAINVGALPSDTMMSVGFDGVGTKIELAERLGYHGSIAFDLLAMVCDDAVVRGAEPVLVGSVLDVNCFYEENVRHIYDVANGYVKAAKKAKVAIINGEVAELGYRVQGKGDLCYNWSAGVVWFANKKRLLDGSKIKIGQSIISLKENGFRSNGLSLVRKIMQEKFGADWHTEKPDTAHKILTPSVIYCAAVCEMFGGAFGEPKADVTGIANVTGGGVPEKLKRVLEPCGHGAFLYDLFNPPKTMERIKELGKVSDEVAYKTWNMGNGMLIITDTPQNVISIANSHSIDARIVGTVIPEKRIEINTYKGNERLIFDNVSGECRKLSWGR